MRGGRSLARSLDDLEKAPPSMRPGTTIVLALLLVVIVGALVVQLFLSA